jgi:hypothetical protein
MLFVFGVLYLICFWICSLVGSALGVPPWERTLAALVLPVISEAGIMLVVNVYQPNLKGPLRALMRWQGVRLLAFLTSIGGVAVFFIFALCQNHLPPRWTFALLVPLVGISALNSLGIDHIPESLEPEEEPGKVVLPEVVPEDADEMEKEIVKQFEWEHAGIHHKIRIALRNATYKDALSHPRNLNTGQWAQCYVTNGMCGEVYVLAEELARIRQPFGTYDEVSFVLDFIQQVIAYKADIGEYPRYPIETLTEAGGDCEDYAILGAAILLALGYEVALLFVPGHCALGVAGVRGIEGVSLRANGLSYFYCETTGKGWSFGKFPEEFRPDQISVSCVPNPAKKVVKEDRELIHR